MQYIEPVGAIGPANAFGHDYVDENAGLGIAGSFLPADVPEHVQIEILNVIVAAGFPPSAGNLKQLAQSIQKGLNFANATGTANSWVVAPALAVPAYAAGRVLWVKAPATNTATAVTVDVSGLGPRPLKKRSGGDPDVGDIVGNTIYPLVDDGTNLRIVAPLASDFTSAASLQPIYPEVLTGANALTATATTGQIVVDPAQAWQHRGLIRFSSDSLSAPDRTFATVASKIYHLVWDAPGTGLATPLVTYPSGRFSLFDRTAASPVETDRSYDTTYDRMLCMLVVTSGGNELTVTPLANRATLSATLVKATLETGANWSSLPTLTATLNWSRTPQLSLKSFDADATTTSVETVTSVYSNGTRYSMSGGVNGYVSGNPVGSQYISGALSVEARA